MRGGAAALARYMEQSRSIPTATSFRTLTVTVLDGRRQQLKAGPRKVSFTHLIAYAIARAAEQMPVMANHFEEIDGKPHRIHRRPGQPRPRRRRREEGRLAHADGAGDRATPARSASPRFLDAYDALVEKARTNTLTADDLVGANITLTNPGGIGTIASVPRLMTGQGTIVATGSIAYPPGLGDDRRDDRRREGHDDDLDLRPPRSSRAPSRAASWRSIEEHLQGEHGFYEARLRGPGRRSSAPPPPPPAPAAAAAAAAARAAPAPAGEEMLQAVQAATHLRRARAQPRPPRGAARPARLRARGRPGARPRGARPDAGAAGADPGAPLPDVRAGRDARRRAAPPARDLLRHDRLRDRAHRLAPPARVAARAHRVGHASATS